MARTAPLDQAIPHAERGPLSLGWRSLRALSAGELGTDLVSLGSAHLGVYGQGLLPLVAGLLEVCVGVVGAGQAVAGAGLPVFVACLAG